MPHLKDALRRVFITACMLTRTTELATRWLGAGFFLPALFVLRYASMGGLDRQAFAAQLQSVRSFKDDAWCGHWHALAQAHIEAIAAASPRFVDPSAATGLNLNALREALAPLGQRVATLMSMSEADAQRALAAEPAASPETRAAVVALRCVVKAVTYHQVGAFPGGSEARMAAYARSRSLFHALTEVVGPLLGLQIERERIEVAGDVVEGYLVTPHGSGRHPLAIITNGLEGTVQELAIPLLKYHDSGMAVFVMEMPGTYAYRQPMSLASEGVYRDVIAQLRGHPLIDPHRLGFVGVSFGGHWAARMAASSPYLRCVVACGAPTHRSFMPHSTIGIPDIIIQALRTTTGATTLMGLGLKLKALSLRHRYGQIQVPLLVINGDRDTLLSTQDSVDLAAGAVNATLKLYPHDDHCAMAHYQEWLDLSQAWMRQILMPDA